MGGFIMEWFEGSIGEAIQTAKMSKSIFVVVVHGADDEETSKNFLEVLNDAEISTKLKKPNAICIKVQNGSQSCTQFSQIYPVILIPSIYFIDSQSGVNIETTGGTVDKEKIIESINKALEGQEKDTASATGVADSIASPRNERVEQARQVLQSEVVPSQSSSTEDKRLLADKQAQKAKEEQEKMKESEAERREMGKNVQAMKRKHEDEEVRKAA